MTFRHCRLILMVCLTCVRYEDGSGTAHHRISDLVVEHGSREAGGLRVDFFTGTQLVFLSSKLVTRQKTNPSQ